MLNWLKRTWMWLALIIGAIAFYGDPAQLATTAYRLSAIALILIVVDFMLDSRDGWGLFHKLDMNRAINRAQQEPMSAAVMIVAVFALIITILFLSFPAQGAEIDRAKPYVSTFKTAATQAWPSMPLSYIPAGQVEQESDWNPKATLKTSRELGRGLAQITIAYDAKGNVRFNNFLDLVRNKAMNGWNWKDDPYNAKYQLMSLFLTDHQNFVQVRKFTMNDEEAWKCGLVCYNAGSGRWLSRRKAARTSGAPADRWTGGLENVHNSGENQALYGQPLWKAVNAYPKLIFAKALKYKGLV